MAAAPKENLGRIPCPCCGVPVALKRSGTQKLSYVCDDADCEMSGYANPGTGAARKWLSQVVRRAAPASKAGKADQVDQVDLAEKPKPTKTGQEAPKAPDLSQDTNPAPKKAPAAGFDLLAALVGPKK